MTKSNPFQQYGITSGLAAAAAAKASAVAASGLTLEYVGVPTPIGIRIEVKVEMMKQINARAGIAAVRKFSGDNPDTLNGSLFQSLAVIRDDIEIRIHAGEGIGIVVSDGLPVRKGDPAVNPTARMMIENAVREVSKSTGCDIYISVPDGENLAKNTMNQRVGISGGISILGTTGIEEPVSGPDYASHIEYLIKTGRCVSTVAVLCPGNTAMGFAESYFRLNPASFILTGDRIGPAIEMAIENGFKEIVVFGLPGKLVKMAAGVMNTHSRVADARFETIAAYAALNGANKDAILAILMSNTVVSAFSVLRNIGLMDSVVKSIVDRIVSRLRSMYGGSAEFSCVIVDGEGKPYAFRLSRGIMKLVSDDGKRRMGI